MRKRWPLCTAVVVVVLFHCSVGCLWLQRKGKRNPWHTQSPFHIFAPLCDAFLNECGKLFLAPPNYKTNRKKETKKILLAPSFSDGTASGIQIIFFSGSTQTSHIDDYLG